MHGSPSRRQLLASLRRAGDQPSAPPLAGGGCSETVLGAGPGCSSEPAQETSRMELATKIEAGMSVREAMDSPFVMCSVSG